MPRVRGQGLRKHQRWLTKWAGGFWGRSSSVYVLSLSKVRQTWINSVRGRHAGRRRARQLWQFRIGAASAEHDIAYSRFICSLQRDNIWLNRKMLADFALNEPYTFREIANHAKVCSAKYRVPPSHFFAHKNY